MTDAELHELITKTERLMASAGIACRDTWCGLAGPNMDDFFVNGNCYDGPRHLTVDSAADGYARVHARNYSTPGMKHVGYDGYKIIIPERLVGRLDIVIHELVHFLQESTSKDEANYIEYDGTNYAKYLKQKSEQEAHYIQLLYILENYPTSVPKKIVSKIPAKNADERFAIALEAKLAGVLR